MVWISGMSASSRSLFTVVYLCLVIWLNDVSGSGVACVHTPANDNFLMMCEDGCDSYRIPDNVGTFGTPALNIRDSSSDHTSCNLTLQTRQGIGLYITVGTLFDISSCGGWCGADTFTSFTDQNASRCVCGEKIPARNVLFLTNKSSLTISYGLGSQSDADVAFSLYVRPVGCLTEDLYQGRKADWMLIEGGPSTAQNYKARVTCIDGFIINNTYTYLDNECVIPTGTEKMGRWTKPSVQCVKIRCGPPPAVNNGYYTPNGTRNGTYGYNKTISYTCDRGYEVTGGSPTRRCIGENGVGEKFEGENPICSKKDCGAPPPPPHGFFVGTETDYQSIHNITCRRGYIKAHEDQDHILCQEDGTWSASPTCQVIECPGVPEVLNATYKIKSGLNGMHNGYQASWVYTCNPGFNMLGYEFSECQANGTWSMPPICGVDRCNLDALPPLVDHVCVNCARNLYNRVNDTRIYRCTQGFTDRESIVRCRYTGGWTSPTSCTLVNCMQPEPIANGEWEVASSTYEGGARLVCDLGYNPAKEGNLKCSMDGSWVDSPGPCKPVDCGTPPSHPHLAIANNTYTTVYQSEMTYACVPGYTMSSLFAKVECLGFGDWSGLPTCDIVDCGEPEKRNIENGTYSTYTSTTYGTEIKYECDTGLMFVNSIKSMKCLANGEWSQLPECVVIDCESPENITLAELMSFTGTSLGDVASYLCTADDGMGVEMEATCGDEGDWIYPECFGASDDTMIYVYIGCTAGALLLIVLVVILVVGCRFKRNARKELPKVEIPDKSARADKGSHSSNDSGLSVDRDPDHPPSITSYDYKNGGLLIKSSTLNRPQGSPPGPYSTSSLTKPRSRLPIADGVNLEMMSMEDEDIQNPLYGEQRVDRVRASKNSSPCNFSNSSTLNSPPQNNLDQVDNNYTQASTLSVPYDRQGGSNAGSLGRYNTAHSKPWAMPGQEHNSHTLGYNSPRSQKTYANQAPVYM